MRLVVVVVVVVQGGDVIIITNCDTVAVGARVTTFADTILKLLLNVVLVVKLFPQL